jgi:hypothetical protein
MLTTPPAVFKYDKKRASSVSSVYLTGVGYSDSEPPAEIAYGVWSLCPLAKLQHRNSKPSPSEALNAARWGRPQAISRWV